MWLNLSCADWKKVMRQMSKNISNVIPATIKSQTSPILHQVLPVSSHQPLRKNQLLILLGTIHILRKHLYSTKLNLTSKIFTKTGFFRQNKSGVFQHYILTKFSCCSLKLSVHKEEKNIQKIREIVVVDIKDSQCKQGTRVILTKSWRL